MAQIEHIFCCYRLQYFLILGLQPNICINLGEYNIIVKDLSTYAGCARTVQRALQLDLIRKLIMKHCQQPAFPHLGCRNTPSSHTRAHTYKIDKRCMCMRVLALSADRCFRLSPETGQLLLISIKHAGCFVLRISANWLQRQTARCILRECVSSV